MAVSNGSLKKSNGHVNGGINGKAEGQPPARRSRSARKNQAFVPWALNNLIRLTTWFSIITVLFRCPPTRDLCDDSSPFLCKYYFQTREIVTPHVQPYYNKYAAPYVQVAQPYYDTVNDKVITPASAYAVQYGGPYVEQARELGYVQWEKNGQPQLEKLQQLAQANYDKTVAPYLTQAGDAIGPYYEVAKTQGSQAYGQYLLPSYAYVQPYAAHGYNVASDFTLTTALPTAYWAWGKSYAFLDTAVWPQLRIVYLENVEPQLVRIGERLGRYKNKVKSNAKSPKATDSDKSAAPSSFNKPATPSSETSTSSSAAPQATVAQDAEIDISSPVEAPPAAANESEKRKKAREMVAEDLELWQTKFAAQADEGANDMEERLDVIAKRMVDNNAQTTGKTLVEKLEATVASETESLKQKISEAIAKVEDSSEEAEESSLQAVRAAGVAIKEKAQAVREWRKTYDTELHNTVVKAADIHFQILDETRNLALQEIGMRWAWAEGVTYKDWEKYHELKATLKEWIDQLKELIITHPSLHKAQEASAEVEDESMAIASEAAKELGRLKEVAHLKIVAKDATDNFESEAMGVAAKVAATASQAAAAASSKAAEASLAAKAEAEAAASAAADKVEEGSSSVSSAAEKVASSVAGTASEVSEAVDSSSTAASQSASSVLAEAESATSEAGDEVLETVEVAESVVTATLSSISADGEDVLSSASSLVSSASDEASSGVSEVFSEVSEAASSDSSIASSMGSDASSAASDYIEDKGETASSFASQASEAIVGRTESIVANLSDGDDGEAPEGIIEEDPSTAKDDTPISDQTPLVKPAFIPGAAAQKVPERKPILDDYDEDDATGVVSSIGDSAQQAYSDAIAAAAAQYTSAVSVVSAQIYGTPKPVHEELLASLSAGYDGAIAAANTKWTELVNGVKATATEAPKPTALVDWSKVESVAAQRLNEGRLWAELQYQSAVIALGLATPTPNSVSEKYLNEAKKNYYAGLGLAQERYSSFIGAASSAMSSMTATPTPTDFAGTASSIASVARESAASAYQGAQDAYQGAQDAAEKVINEATDNVASAINAFDEGVYSVIDGATEQVYLAGSAIADTWDNVIQQINGQVYGEQKQLGWYDSLFSDASSAASAATEAVADQAQALTGAAGDSAATASAEAAKQYSAVNDIVSELISGKEPSFTESVLSRLNAAYSTAASNVGNYASEASEAAASVVDKVGSAASQATDSVKETVKHGKDEL